MGKVTYSKGGTIESGSSITKCSRPEKRYTKNLEAKVQGSIDSLGKLPKSNLALELQQTVTRLSDYSSEGLDIGLILFRICEMANNRGLTPSQVDTLTKIALDAWAAKKQSPTSIINNGTNNGIMAGVVVVPEDKEIPFENNFVINIKENSVIAMPKQGFWYQPYIGYPSDEDSLQKWEMFNPASGLIQRAFAYEKIQYKSVSYNITIQSVSSSPATKNFGYGLRYTKKPTFILFGDLTDSSKQYVKEL